MVGDDIALQPLQEPSASIVRSAAGSQVGPRKHQAQMRLIEEALIQQAFEPFQRTRRRERHVAIADHFAPPTGLVDRCLLWRLPVGVTSPLRTAHGCTRAIHPTKERLDRFGIGLTGQLGDQEATQDVVGVGVDPALRFTEGRHHRAVCGHEGSPIFWHHLISGVGQVFGQAAGVPQQ